MSTTRTNGSEQASMETIPYSTLKPISLFSPSKHHHFFQPGISPWKCRNRSIPLSATLKNSPKGFGTPPKKPKKTKKPTKNFDENDEDSDEEDEDDEDRDTAGVIPEIVTNRMMSRIGFTVGIPLFTGLLFFPFFYYLKTGLKIDVPTWVPFIVSFVFFGTALLGISYGIVSASWDPLREGSLLGWNEAQRNWPVFWESFWGGGSGSKKNKY